ncbi:5'-AMP-activated_protein kinase [Hexamita inflata]|uniref:Beta subunit n=1 Tax=Hexamita inflata TaxID=28002 RepID=A0AA86VGA4_9EUKA|nr:5'-AMP-activated protein kinase [Hexamita inflata]
MGHQELTTPTRFSWDGPCHEVYVSGSFTNWEQKIKLDNVDGVHSSVLHLIPGPYQFKFIVDDVWETSNGYELVHDELGNANNYILVGHPFENPEMKQLDQQFTTRVPLQPEQMWANFPVEVPKVLVRTPLNANIMSKQYVPQTLLQIPDHVILNHFFRQRKRKAYQVNSSTVRYRSKYVTVVLYQALDDGTQTEVPELVDIFEKYQLK